MLLVDFRSCGIPELDLEVLVEALSKQSDGIAVVLSQDCFFDAYQSASKQIFWVCSPQGNGRNDDLMSVAICISLNPKAGLGTVIRASVDAGIELLPVPYGLAGSALLGKLASVCAAGGLRERASHLHGVRSWFLKMSGPLHSPLANELRLYSVYIDAQIALFSHLRPESTAVLANGELLDDWEKLTDNVIAHLEKILGDCPELAPWLKGHLVFFKHGAQLRKQSLSHAKKGVWCDFLRWLSVYFIQMATLFLDSGDWSASICCSTRALESYLTMWAISEGTMILDVYGIRFASGKTPQGLRPIWESVRNQVQSSFTPQQLDTVKEVTAVIFVRNRTAFTHGVQNAGRGVAEDCLRIVRDVLFLLEKVGGDQRRVFAGLLQLSSEALSAGSLEEFSGRAFGCMAKPVCQAACRP